MHISKIYFDRQDRQLLRMVNDALSQSGAIWDEAAYTEHRVFDANLHPHGILELATTHEFRVAHAVINLLGSLEAGRAEDRLLALKALRDEVLHSARTPFRYNTGRVLVQIMKEIVRSRGDEYTQLKLVHDFRRAASGNPRIVRRFLTRHHLLEMPEEWNQLTLDHHVHDANTKGRKNPTHLIMDAWVKGIRNLTVVYYNFVEPDAAREVLEAADIMGIFVRIGLEFRSPFRGRYVNFVWAPRGFLDAESFLSFLAEGPTQTLLQEGRKASQWTSRHVLETLGCWNGQHAPALSRELGIRVPDIDEQAFLAFVGNGQPSLLHLAEYTHKLLLPALTARARELAKEAAGAAKERRAVIDALIERMDALTPEMILENWLKPERNPQLGSPNVPHADPDVPEILRLTPKVLLDWLTTLRSGYRITLQLADLTPEDVLELIWDCRGMITHLELFNLKEWQEGRLMHLAAINELQRAINEGSVPYLKHSIRAMIRRMEASADSADHERSEKFRLMLRDIPGLQAPYRIAPLGSHIGTDSTSHSGIRHGMGLAVLETLPPGARRILAKNKDMRSLPLPVQVSLTQRESWSPSNRLSPAAALADRCIRALPGCKKFGFRHEREWLATAFTIRPSKKSNLITMGGIGGVADNGLRRVVPDCPQETKPGLAYLNTRFSNMLKVLIGFIPAMLCFYFTQQWWLLVWFGAPIWFAITGLRNIAQAVLGGGGIRQSSLLRWNNYVDWTRICDSLMYTGLSVVLLEWLIRCVLLEKGFHLTLDEHPLLVFTIISTANSLYIASHNIFRGLQKEAVIGNLFRNFLAIPLSMIYYDLLYGLLTILAVADPILMLQPGAAIISKAASDTVAGIIEGFADGHTNRRLRYWDYTTKLNHLFNCYSRMELAFPDLDLLSLLSRPQDFIRVVSADRKDMTTAAIINALDLMYFWLYLPYAQQTLVSMLRTLSREERVILARSQHVLVRIREVSQLFVDGFLGRNFSRALSFYLNSHEDYIRAMNKHCSHP